MNIPFSASELVGLLVILAGIVSAYVELKIGKKNHEARLAKLEEAVEQLQKNAVTVALLEQAVENLQQVGTTLTQEMASTRSAMDAVVRSLVRIETKLQMEDRRKA